MATYTKRRGSSSSSSKKVLSSAPRILHIQLMKVQIPRSWDTAPQFPKLRKMRIAESLQPAMPQHPAMECIVKLPKPSSAAAEGGENEDPSHPASHNILKGPFGFERRVNGEEWRAGEGVKAANIARRSKWDYESV